jgi:NAD(P)-dependent dehydrogenase (short-subunit alcohol dehydrogenase family)
MNHTATRRVLVLGGGIGRVIALAAHAAGDVALLAARTTVPNIGLNQLQVSLSEPIEYERAVELGVAGLGGLDVLCVCAGPVHPWPSSAGNSGEEWCRRHIRNTLSASRACQSALPAFGAGPGVIVIVSGLDTPPANVQPAHYAAACAALATMTKDLAVDVTRRDIRVFGVAADTRFAPAPGSQPISRGTTTAFVQPSRFAQRVLALIDDTSADGDTVLIDGGGSSDRPRTDRPFRRMTPVATTAAAH